MANSFDAKIVRAKEHLNDLHAEIRRFLDTNPYGIVLKPDEKPGHHRAKIAFSEPTPPRILIIAGDILHNLRGALDHLYWDLMHARARLTEAEERRLQFPITEDADGYQARRQEIRRFRPDILDMFDTLKPYKGGNYTLWCLNRLSNIDKHRALLTVGLHSYQLRILKKETPPPEAAISGGAAPAEHITTVTITPPFPLKDGDVLATGVTEAESCNQTNYTYGIAFNEPGVIEGTEIIETLAFLLNSVDHIVETLRVLI